MNGFEKVTRWVEYKIGRLLTKDINEKIKKCDSSFDVDNHAKMLFEMHFSQDLLKAEFLNENYNLNFESDDFNSMDGYSQYSSSDDQYDFQALTLDNIILGLQSTYEEEKQRALEALESFPIEELIVHTSWTMACKILQDILKSSDSERATNQVLKLFHRFLSSTDSPRIVCESFISLTKNVTHRIEVINRRESKEIFQDIYDFRENKWMFNGSNSHSSKSVKKKSEIEIIFRSMWLLILSQKSMPLKWSRFNEKRLKDIIFSFIHMLSSSSNSEDKNYISGLEILAVLDPKASWCNHWCHGATGRTLFCSAIKSHNNFFSHIVNFILISIKNKESTVKFGTKEACDFTFKLPPLKEDYKAGNKKDNFITTESCDMKSNGLYTKEKYSRTWLSSRLKDEKALRDTRSNCLLSNDNHLNIISEANAEKSDWVIGEISKEIVKEAKLCHFISLIACLIRYRGGRSLFPLVITSGIRINISDFVVMLINYVDRIISCSEKKTLITAEYKNHMLKIVNILKSV